MNKAYEAFTLKTRGVAMTLPRPTLYVGDVYFLRPHEKVTHIHCTIPGEPNIRQWIMSCSSFMPNLRCVAMLGLFPPNQRQADVNPVFGHDETYASLERHLKKTLALVKFAVNLSGENKSGGSGKGGGDLISQHLFILDFTTKSTRLNYAKKFCFQVEENPVKKLIRQKAYKRSADDLKSMIAKRDGCGDIEWIDKHFEVDFEMAAGGWLVDDETQMVRKRAKTVFYGA